MLELTVCGNTCDVLAAAHIRKSHKQEYLQLLSNAVGEMAGKPNTHTTIKFGALGHYNPVAPAKVSPFQSGEKLTSSELEAHHWTACGGHCWKQSCYQTKFATLLRKSSRST